MFQRDNAPVRKASSRKTWRVKVGVEELEGSAQSADLNPTQHRLNPRPPYPTSVSDLANAFVAE